MLVGRGGGGGGGVSRSGVRARAAAVRRRAGVALLTVIQEDKLPHAQAQVEDGLHHDDLADDQDGVPFLFGFSGGGGSTRGEEGRLSGGGGGARAPTRRGATLVCSCVASSRARERQRLMHVEASPSCACVRRRTGPRGSSPMVRGARKQLPTATGGRAALCRARALVPARAGHPRRTVDRMNIALAGRRHTGGARPRAARARRELP